MNPLSSMISSTKPMHETMMIMRMRINGMNVKKSINNHRDYVPPLFSNSDLGSFPLFLYLYKKGVGDEAKYLAL